MSWKDVLTNPEGRQSPHANPNLVDLSPLAEPVNAFGFAAANIRRQRDTGRYPETKEEKEKTDLQLAWLDHLAIEVPYMTAHPVEAFAIGRLSCNSRARALFIAALSGLIELGQRPAPKKG